jgi:hypothetical protein
MASSEAPRIEFARALKAQQGIPQQAGKSVDFPKCFIHYLWDIYWKYLGIDVYVYVYIYI